MGGVHFWRRNCKGAWVGVSVFGIWVGLGLGSILVSLFDLLQVIIASVYSMSYLSLRY